MSYKTLDEVYDIFLKKEIGNELYLALKFFRINWTQKSDDYIEFLGNNLTGVQPIRFSTLDEQTFYNILNVDHDSLQKELYKVKGINKDFRTISNATYLTLVYLMHKFSITRELDNKTKEDAVKELYYIFCYKVISSLNSHYFKYNIDVSIAKAINERMTARYLVKRFNSWQEIFEYKTNDMFGRGVHAKRIVSGSTDDITRVISDIQTKLRDLFKNNYAVFMEVMEQNERIASSSLLTENEDGEAIRDLSKRKDYYIDYIKSIVILPNDFINHDLAEVISSVYKSINHKKLLEVLKYISENYQKDKYWDKMIEDSMINFLYYLDKKGIKDNYVKQLYEAINILKGYFAAQKVNDKVIKELKKDLPKKIKSIVNISNTVVLMNLSSAVLVYVLCRSFFNKNN